MVNPNPLTPAHKQKLREASEKWWQLNQGSDFIKERNRKISTRLLKRKEDGLISPLKGILTGIYKKCQECDKTFYALPSMASKKKFCNRTCMIAYIRRTGGYAKGRKYCQNLSRQQLREQVHQCETCGFNDERILIIHHKDGNPKHNKRENLILLCPNCHTLEHLKLSGRLKLKGKPNGNNGLKSSGKEW